MSSTFIRFWVQCRDEYGAVFMAPATIGEAEDILDIVKKQKEEEELKDTNAAIH